MSASFLFFGSDTVKLRESLNSSCYQVDVETWSMAELTALGMVTTQEMILYSRFEIFEIFEIQKGEIDNPQLSPKPISFFGYG